MSIQHSPPLGTFAGRKCLASLSNLSSNIIWGRELCWSMRKSNNTSAKKLRVNSSGPRVFAMSPSSFKMNLNEYMVTLEKPLGIRFALTFDGDIIVHSLKKGANAEKSRIIMVGDTLRKATEQSTGNLIEIKGIDDTVCITKQKSGTCSLVFERPFSPFPIQHLHPINFIDVLFNKGRVPVSTWNKNILVPSLSTSCDGNGNSGFVVFSSKFLSVQGWEVLNKQKGQVQKSNISLPFLQLVTIFSEEESGDIDWAHGNFPLEEYIKALDRSKGELHYNHNLGMRYSKGITAVMNFQSEIEAENWGVNWNLINETCKQSNILMINYPIRDGDSFDMRKKLPFCVGLLLRLLKKNHRVYVTCTTGFDRSPACVIAYLHWMTDTSLQVSHNFVTDQHSCKPDRSAITWATWDLIALVEQGRHDGPATHVVTFVWNGQEGEDVHLVGDFTGNWKEPIQAVHKGGPRFEIDVRLSHGKYYYKYIINEEWRHSMGSPVERDESGNMNNVIVVGDTASIQQPVSRQPKKDANSVKVIERPLTETERFLLAKAARYVAFSICPIRLSPK